MAAVQETIVALSSSLTAPQREPQRAVLRLSGPRAVELAGMVFKVQARENHKLTQRNAEPQSLDEALVAKRWRRVPGKVLWRGKHELDAHVYVMPAPRSFTREDVAELHVPGIPWLVDEMLDTLVRSGARLAQAGEFTRRAFEHGRISLAQAEAVAQLISSGSAEEARAHALRLITHADARRQKLKAGLEELLSQVELGLDFAHEDVIVIEPAEIARRLEALKILSRDWLHELASEPAESAARGLPRIVLAGPTNAGKSSLFNALLKRDAAIVSAQRNTTRDAVEGRLTLQFETKDYDAVLIDSAGSAAPGAGSAHERAARDATAYALRCADLVLVVLDAALPLEAHEGLPALLAQAAAFNDNAAALVWTKTDLIDKGSTLPRTIHDRQFGHSFGVSALSGAGLDVLREFLASRAAELSRRSGEARAAAGAALHSAAQAAHKALLRAADALPQGSGEDALAVELREALHACWQAEGIFQRHDAVTEAALDRIFAQFCVGK